MSQFREMMRRARRDASDGDWSPQPGVHDAVVVEGDAFESRAGVPYAKTRLELRTQGDPDYGRHWDHLMGFGSPQQQAMSAGQLSVYGLDDETIDNLEDIHALAREMGELVGTEVEVSCTARDSGDGVWTSVTRSKPSAARAGNGTDPVGPDREGLPTGAGEQAHLGDDEDVPF